MPNLYLTLKSKKSSFWNILFLILWFNYVALNINLKSEWVFWNSKISRKRKIKGSCWSYKWNSAFSNNLGQKVVKKFTKLNKISFFYGMFYSWFFTTFQQKRQSLALGCLARYPPLISSIPRTFLKFPNSLRS